MGAIRRTRAARPAVRGAAWRLRGRSGRDDDRNGSLRPRPGARTISCDGRARRRLSSPWRQRRAMRRSHPEDRGRQPHLRLRPYRAAIALRPARYRDASGARRGRVGARRREGGRRARRHRRQADRHRAGRRRAARPRRGRRLYRRREGRRSIAPRLPDPGRPARRGDYLCECEGRSRRGARRAGERHCRSSNASSTRRSRRCAPRPSVRWL